MDCCRTSNPSNTPRNNGMESLSVSQARYLSKILKDTSITNMELVTPPQPQQVMDAAAKAVRGPEKATLRVQAVNVSHHVTLLTSDAATSVLPPLSGCIVGRLSPLGLLGVRDVRSRRSVSVADVLVVASA